MVRFIVEDENGDQHVGAGFHIGDGWIATAKHNFDGHASVRACRETDGSAISFTRELRHTDPNIDVLCLKSDVEMFPASIRLGRHLDAWVRDEFLLSKVLIMGFPRIPLTDRNPLVCAEAEVNAVVRLLVHPALHFVLSSTARGGFSGGPAITDEGELLGIIVTSLLNNNEHETTGFCAALSVQPLLQILKQLSTRPPFIPRDIWQTIT